MAEAEDAKVEPEVEDEEMNVTLNGKPLMREETDENGETKKKKITLAYFTEEGYRYAIVCPVDSGWGTVGDQDDAENPRDVLKQAAILEQCYVDNGYLLLLHPDRKKGDKPIYWDEEALGKIGKILHENKPLGAAVYMYADGYMRNIAMRVGDSDEYKPLDLREWIKQFGDCDDYKFTTMHEGVGCPIEISLDINQMPAENIKEELEDKSEKAIKCKGPFRAQPRGTFTIVSEGGIRKKPKSFHTIALQAYSHKDFNSKLMAHWGDLRKRKAGGRFIDNIESKFAYQGGMFQVPDNLPPSHIQKQKTDKHLIQVVRMIKKTIDPSVSVDIQKDWVTIGSFHETPKDWTIINDKGNFIAGNYKPGAGFNGFVLNTIINEKYNTALVDIVKNETPMSEKSLAKALAAKTIVDLIAACNADSLGFNPKGAEEEEEVEAR